MLTTIKGYYEDGRITLQEEPPVSARTEVLITFLTNEAETQTTDARKRQDAASSSEATSNDKEDTSGYVVVESGLGIDE